VCGLLCKLLVQLRRLKRLHLRSLILLHLKI
jgi:hypothetical protein